jgi:toxin secretion/phage lysis holin
MISSRLPIHLWIPILFSINIKIEFTLRYSTSSLLAQKQIKEQTKLEKVIDVCAKLVALFFGVGDELLYALILFVFLDYITGICVAIHNRELSSSIGAKGITKKVVIFLVVSVAHVADQYLMESNNVLRTVTIMFYLSNECISIFENVGKLGVPLPARLDSLLQYLKNSANGNSKQS